MSRSDWGSNVGSFWFRRFLGQGVSYSKGGLPYSLPSVYIGYSEYRVVIILSVCVTLF